MKRKRIIAAAVAAVLLCGCGAADKPQSSSADNDGGYAFTTFGDYAPSAPEGGSDPFAGGSVTAADVMQMNTTRAVIEKYDSMQNIVSYTNMKDREDYTQYQYIERNGSGGYNYINYLGKDYIMADYEGRTYLRYSVGGSPQLYTIFAFKEDYDGVFEQSYLSDVVSNEYRNAAVSDYQVKNSNTYSFFLDRDVGEAFASEYRKSYDITSMDILREKYVVDSGLMLRSSSLEVVPEEGMPLEIMNSARLYNIKVEMPGFVKELAEPSDPIKVTVFCGTDTDSPKKEELYVQNGTHLGFHYLVNRIFTDEQLRRPYSPDVPITAPISIYIKPET